MDYLSTFEQKEIEITKEQAQKLDTAITAFNSAMINSSVPIRLKLDDEHNTKRFFLYTDWINTEPSIEDCDGNRVFNGDICSARASGVGGSVSEGYGDGGYEYSGYEGDDIDADPQPIKIWKDEDGVVHSSLYATGGSTGNEPDDGPAFADDHEFEQEEISLIESK